MGTPKAMFRGPGGGGTPNHSQKGPKEAELLRPGNQEATLGSAWDPIGSYLEGPEGPRDAGDCVQAN